MRSNVPERRWMDNPLFFTSSDADEQSTNSNSNIFRCRCMITTRIYSISSPNHRRIVLLPSPKSMNYFIFRSSLKSTNFLILKNSNNILPLYIILFTTYIIVINTYTIIIMWTQLSTNIISTTLSLSLNFPYLLKLVCRCRCIISLYTTRIYSMSSLE